MNHLEAMNLEYSASKRWLGRSLILSGAFYLCSFGVLASGWWTRASALIAFVLQVSIMLSRRSSNAHYSSAESIRRPAMLQNGLGIAPSALPLARIAARVGIASADNRISSEEYYASSSPPGAIRLVEITEESAFWSGELAKKAAAFIWQFLVCAAVLIAVVVAMAINMGIPRNITDAFAKALLATLTFWFTGDLLTLMWRYESLSGSLQEVLTNCEGLLSHPDKMDRDATILMGEYNCALAGAPVIPEFVYRWNRNRLNAAWAIRQSPAQRPNSP